jgi:hypothetical protein
MWRRGGGAKPRKTCGRETASGALASKGVVLVRKMSGCGGARNAGLLRRARGGARHVATRRMARMSWCGGGGARHAGASGALASAKGYACA